MSEVEVTPVSPAVEAVKADAAEAAKVQAGTAPKVSPAQDIRNIQMLLVSGIYPGNVAPQIVAAYQLLEKLASKIELDAQHEEEWKARQAVGK